MNTKTFKALLILSDNFRCSCGAKYQLLKIIEIVKPYYYLLQVLHEDNGLRELKKYESTIIYNLRTNKLMVDGTTANLGETRQNLWKKIKERKVK